MTDEHRSSLNYLWVMCFLALLTTACQSDSKSSTSAPAPTVSVPNFSGDSAYAFVQKQVDFGFRVPGTEDHVACGNWLAAKLQSYGWAVTKQPFKASFFNSKNVDCVNIIGQLNPSHPKRIVLAAHWDTRIIADKEGNIDKRDNPILGADDGASGVAVLLELARQLSQQEIDLGVDIVLFDAEDQGDAKSNNARLWALGSQYWSNRAVAEGYKAQYGILLDMVGSENATFGKEGHSVRYAPAQVEKIWTLAKRMGYSDFFQSWNSGAVTDDHYYVNTIAKIPMIDIINISSADRRSFGHYHHTHKDNMDIISRRTLKVVGQVVMTVLYKEAEGVL